MLLQFRFPLRTFFVQLRIFETGAGLCGSCELIEVTQELNDVVATGGRAPVIVTPGFAREDWIIFMSQKTGQNAVGLLLYFCFWVVT